MHLRNAVTTVSELLALVDVDPEDVAGGVSSQSELPVRVPRPYVDRMRRGDPRDPLLLQVLPTSAEREAADGFITDPVGERGRSPVDGVIHRYEGRVLLVTTGACGVTCRYCFRRHFPYEEHVGWADGWERALAFLAAAPTVSEVILSGGDPLVVSDDKLGRLHAGLESIPHVRRLRVHSRLPVVVPSRVDDGLLGWCGAGRLAAVLVLHVNHPRELDSEVAAAVTRLRSAGVLVLNQSVLLRGVNDAVEILAELSEGLFAIGVVPYYLHLLDRVRGAAHFEVPRARAQKLARELAARLPGYLVPRLVRDVPGAPSKAPVGWEG